MTTCHFKNQKELFNYIWETREHRSELSGRPLLPKGSLKWHWQFLHVLPKGSYPAYKLKPENILLGLPEEHERQENFDIFNEKYSELRKQYYKEIYNKKIIK